MEKSGYHDGDGVAGGAEFAALGVPSGDDGGGLAGVLGEVGDVGGVSGGEAGEAPATEVGGVGWRWDRGGMRGSGVGDGVEDEGAGGRRGFGSAGGGGGVGEDDGVAEAVRGAEADPRLGRGRVGGEAAAAEGVGVRGEAEGDELAVCDGAAAGGAAGLDLADAGADQALHLGPRGVALLDGDARPRARVGALRDGSRERAHRHQQRRRVLGREAEGRRAGGDLGEEVRRPGEQVRIGLRKVLLAGHGIAP